MALITCKDCHKEFSSDTKRCPHCGAKKPSKPVPLVVCKKCKTEFCRDEKKCPQCGVQKPLSAGTIVVLVLAVLFFVGEGAKIGEQRDNAATYIIAIIVIVWCLFSERKGKVPQGMDARKPLRTGTIVALFIPLMIAVILVTGAVDVGMAAKQKNAAKEQDRQEILEALNKQPADTFPVDTIFGVWSDNCNHPTEIQVYNKDFSGSIIATRNAPDNGVVEQVQQTLQAQGNIVETILLMPDGKTSSGHKFMVINDNMIAVIQDLDKDLADAIGWIKLNGNEYATAALHLCSRDPNEINEKLKLAEADQQRWEQWSLEQAEKTRRQYETH
jgi:RNA polymerase subunit RPABC4/transcription elongation factor Spt4